MKRQMIITTTAVMLILLWTYAATSKLIDFEQSRREMHNQVFSNSTAEVLVWAVPALELVVAALLLFPRTLRAGLYASLALLGLFTGYISLVMTNVLGRVPCSCGGVLEEMSWGQHLTFNLIFLLLTSFAVITLSQMNSSE